MLRLKHTVQVLNIPLRRRSCSTSLIHPVEIFTQAVSSAPSWPNRTSSSHSQNITTSSLLQWKDAKVDGKKFTANTLSRLQRTLRSVHKRKIAWPVEESGRSDLPPNRYLTTLLGPIVDIFNQLHGPNILNTPMEYILIAFSESIYGGTFMAEDFQSHWITAPIVLCLPDDLFDSHGRVSSHVQYALHKALEYRPSVPSIVISNFKDIAVFLPPAKDRSEAVFERVSTTQPPLALRMISAAFLLQELPTFRKYINSPPPDVAVTLNLVGPPQDPNRLLLPDEVLETHHRHSDFDFITLVRDRARAMQLFRWHDHVQQRHSKVVAGPDDILTAVTNEVGMDVPDIHPIYPYDHSEVPPETATHLEGIRRNSPLVTTGIADLFFKSKSFKLRVEKVVAEGASYGICTVYRCQITSIDGSPVLSPSLCLKLFDDRFQKLYVPDEDDLLSATDGELLELFEQVVIAEAYALNEAFAYEKLLPVQGTVIPWFYGAHQFTLPDGMVLYGLLMEYIEGVDLDTKLPNDLSPERQVNMIQSCRHAVRVLDIADVSQRDWHSGQILLYTNPETQTEHAVLIDFASTTQTWDVDSPNFINNYYGILRVLLGRGCVVPFDQELVWKHFGDPDDWDPVMAKMFRYYPGNKDECVWVKARDLFSYISFA